MIAWLESHATVLWWLSVVSAVTFLGTLALVPVLVVRMPRDFLRRLSRPRPASRVPLVLRILARAVRVVVGTVLVLAGIAMLVLPGQGLLTIALGLIVMGWPGSGAGIRRILSHPPVRRGLDAIRRRFGREPLEYPDDADASNGQP